MYVDGQQHKGDDVHIEAKQTVPSGENQAEIEQDITRVRQDGLKGVDSKIGRIIEWGDEIKSARDSGARQEVTDRTETAESRFLSAGIIDAEEGTAVKDSDAHVEEDDVILKTEKSECQREAVVTETDAIVHGVLLEDVQESGYCRVTKKEDRGVGDVQAESGHVVTEGVVKGNLTQEGIKSEIQSYAKDQPEDKGIDAETREIRTEESEESETQRGFRNRSKVLESNVQWKEATERESVDNGALRDKKDRPEILETGDQSSDIVKSCDEHVEAVDDVQEMKIKPDIQVKTNTTEVGVMDDSVLLADAHEMSDIKISKSEDQTECRKRRQQDSKRHKRPTRNLGDQRQVE